MSNESEPGARLPDPDLSIEVDGDDTIQRTVVEATATVDDAPPTDLPALCDAVNADALDAIFADRSTPGWVSFQYAGYLVKIQDGVVHVLDTDEATE